MPYADYKPGLNRPNLTPDQVKTIDQILADETVCKDLPEIDPFKGVLPTVFSSGMNRRPSAEISLSVFWKQDRFDRGDDCANAIADKVAALLGYPATVWMAIGGDFFQGDSDRDVDDH